MTVTTAQLAAKFKKRIKIGLIITAAGVVLSGIGYFLPASVQLVPLIVGYFGLYVGVIFVLYSLWHRYMSADAEKADKADKAAADAAEAAAAQEAPSSDA